jgi:hypothetical protein
MSLPRKKTFVVFREAAKVGPYDERPMMPDDIQLQVGLSRNTHRQPFFLICEKDTLLAAFSGKGRVEFELTNVRYFPFEAGDHVYVPGGAPTRIDPESESLILRYKAREPGLEAVAWYCETCHAELYRHVFDPAKLPPQAGYLAGCEAFNADASLRGCEACDRQHPSIDLSPYNWAELARQLREP